MEMVTYKAAVGAVTDQGVFTAVISTEDVDRERDVVVASGLVNALRAWIATAKKVPLAWNHGSAPEGSWDGWIPRARRRSATRSRRMAGSIRTPSADEMSDGSRSPAASGSRGYIATDAVKRRGGGRVIKAAKAAKPIDSRPVRIARFEC